MKATTRIGTKHQHHGRLRHARLVARYPCQALAHGKRLDDKNPVGLHIAPRRRLVRGFQDPRQCLGFNRLGLEFSNGLARLDGLKEFHTIGDGEAS